MYVLFLFSLVYCNYIFHVLLLCFHCMMFECRGVLSDCCKMRECLLKIDCYINHINICVDHVIYCIDCHRELMYRVMVH